MELNAGALLILLIIIGAVAALFVVLGGDKKSKKSKGKTISGPAGKSAGGLVGTLVNPPYPLPNPQPQSAPHGELSVFTYQTSTPYWLCPNCECENTMNRTHCCVCFWDRSVEVH